MNIELANLTKVYDGNVVLSIGRLVLDQGEFVGLIGNNGAGKTTLLRLILDLVKPTSGDVRSGGERVSEGEGWKAYTGSYLEEGFLIDYLTPREFFEFVGATRGLSWRETLEELSDFEEFLGPEILHRSRQYIRNLSKGNIQKVGITSAMIGNSQIVVLDEPFASLDPTSQIVLKSILRNYQQRTNALFLISSHNLSQVVDLCSRVILLERGVVIRNELMSGNSREVLARLERYFTPQDSDNSTKCLLG